MILRMFVFLVSIFAITVTQADTIHGVWQTQPGDSGGHLHVELGDCGTNVCGTIIKAIDKDGNANDNYAHLGKKMIWDMQPQEDGFFTGGKIWAPDKDKTYKSKMQLDGDSLTVKGCIAGGLLCRGQDWKRIAS